jgi:hypothetical protein
MELDSILQANKAMEEEKRREEKRSNCKLQHIKNWFNLFVDIHNGMIIVK